MNRRLLLFIRQFVLSGLWGLLSLGAVNLAAVCTHISLGFGWLSGGAAVVFGVPGVVGLLLLNALFSLA